MRCCLVHLGQSEDTLVQGVEVRRRLTVHVVPPVTHEERLVEHRAVGTEEGGLSPIQVAVMPSLKEIDKLEQVQHTGLLLMLLVHCFPVLQERGLYPV